MRYSVTHLTTYNYDDDVTDSLGIAYVVPRELPWQRVWQASVDIHPLPSDMTRDTDFYGNTVTYFQVTEAHQYLEVAGRSEVDVVAPVYDEAPLAQAWEVCQPLSHPSLPGAWHAADMAVESPLVAQTDEAFRYGAAALIPGRPVGEACEALMHLIHEDFDYDKSATTVTSTVEDIFKTRGGVCQDFAHLMIACLRSHGLAARYVSGYLATTPPPGKERVVGADASHAWVAVWVPPLPGAQGDGQWLALDPTNDHRADERYVTVAWGRDYSDVPPVKGVIFTDAKHSQLSVSVDVAPQGA